MKKFISLISLITCFTIIGTAQAQHIAIEVPDQGPVVPYVAPTSVERRNQLCIEEWQKSHAFTKQQCKGIDVRWDSYTLTASFFDNVDNEAHHMKYSRCLVNVRCDKGTSATTLLPARHNAVLNFQDVEKIRRCKANSGQTMNTSCEPLTDEDIQNSSSVGWWYW